MKYKIYGKVIEFVVSVALLIVRKYYKDGEEEFVHSHK